MKLQSVFFTIKAPFSASHVGFCPPSVGLDLLNHDKLDSHGIIELSFCYFVIFDSYKQMYSCYSCIHKQKSVWFLGDLWFAEDLSYLTAGFVKKSSLFHM